MAKYRLKPTLSGCMLATAVVILVAVGPLLPASLRSLLIDIMIFSIYAMAFDILFGYSNQFSYGQATFFGLGAYGILLPVLHAGVNLWTGILIALVLCVIFGLGLGFLSVRLGGAYFVIITIIFNMVFYLLALSWTWLTGGDDGLTFTVPPATIGPLSFSLYNPVVNYYFALVFFVASYVVLRRLVASPIGKILIAIRENEERASLVGYNVFRYKLLAFVISALYTGLAGALYAIRTRYASADYFSIILSGEAIVWAIIGGSGTLIGPTIGVAIINPIIYYVGVFWRHYLIIIGLLLILVLRFSTKGIVGVVKSRLAGRRAR